MPRRVMYIIKGPKIKAITTLVKRLLFMRWVRGLGNPPVEKGEVKNYIPLRLVVIKHQVIWLYSSESSFTVLIVPDSFVEILG